MISIINSDNLGKRKRNLTLAPCYIDTNIIISATLESEPEWQHKNKKNYSDEKGDKKNQIEASHKLLHEWNPDRLYTSSVMSTL